MENQTPPPVTPPMAAPAGPTSWRLYLELLALLGFIIPLGQILGPLVLWLIMKDKNPEVDAEGKKVLNFNISWALWGLVTCGIGFLVWLVILIIAIIKAANREPFKHPLTLELLK